MEKKYLLWNKYTDITILKVGTKRTFIMIVSRHVSKNFRVSFVHFYFSLFNNKLKFKIEASK